MSILFNNQLFIIVDGFKYAKTVTLDDVAIPFIISIDGFENIISG